MNDELTVFAVLISVVVHGGTLILLPEAERASAAPRETLLAVPEIEPPPEPPLPEPERKPETTTEPPRSEVRPAEPARPKPPTAAGKTLIAPGEPSGESEADFSIPQGESERYQGGTTVPVATATKAGQVGPATDRRCRQRRPRRTARAARSRVVDSGLARSSSQRPPRESTQRS